MALQARVPLNYNLPQYTSLITSSLHPYYYNVELEGVGVGGRMLSVDQVIHVGGRAGRHDCAACPPSQRMNCAIEGLSQEQGRAMTQSSCNCIPSLESM